MLPVSTHPGCPALENQWACGWLGRLWRSCGRPTAGRQGREAGGEAGLTASLPFCILRPPTPTDESVLCIVPIKWRAVAKSKVLQYNANWWPA